MARIRSLKPEIWMSPQVMNLSQGARLLFIGLITQADDEGRGTADPRRVKAAIFGGDDCTSTDVRRWLDECSMQNLLLLYTHDKHGLLYQLPSWKSHQSIDRPRKSAYPAHDDSTNTRRSLDEGSSGIGVEGKGSEGSGTYMRSTNPRRAIDEPNTGGDMTRENPDASEPLTDAERMDLFAVVKAAYPKGNFRQSQWLLGERTWCQRLDDGIPPSELLEGVQRYAAFVAGGGVSGSAYVYAPQKFFDVHDRMWREPWNLPEVPKGRKSVAERLAALGPDDEDGDEHAGANA